MMFSLNMVDYTMSHEILVSAPWFWVLGLRVWGQGLTIRMD